MSSRTVKRSSVRPQNSDSVKFKNPPVQYPSQRKRLPSVGYVQDGATARKIEKVAKEIIASDEPRWQRQRKKFTNATTKATTNAKNFASASAKNARKFNFVDSLRNLLTPNRRGGTTRSRPFNVFHEYKEDDAHEEIPIHSRMATFVINPASSFARLWSFVNGLLILYVTFKIPFYFSFSNTDDESAPQFGLLDYCIDVTFCLDVALRFRTGFISKTGRLIMDRSEIGRRYLRSWFLIDLLAAFPWEVLAQEELSFRQSVKLSKFLKVPRLLRVHHILKNLQVSYWNINSTEMWRMVQTLFGIIMLGHWVGCMWFLIVEIDMTYVHGHTIWEAYFQNLAEAFMLLFWVTDPEQMSPPCGDALISQCAARPECPNSMLRDPQNISLALCGDVLEPWCEKYAEFGFCPYENFSVSDSQLHVFTITIYILGGFATSCLYALMAFFLSSTYSKATEFREKIQRVNEDMMYLQVPDQLQFRVQKYYEYLWLNRSGVGETGLLRDEELSMSLRSEIALHMHAKMLRNIELFKHCTKACLADFVTKFVSKVYLPGDSVIVEGQYGHEMYFVSKGCLVISKGAGSDKKTTVIEEATYFGEISLISGAVRNASVNSLTWCNLYCLSSSDFHRVLCDYPNVARNVRRVALAREFETRILMGIDGEDEKSVMNWVLAKYSRVKVGTITSRADLWQVQRHIMKRNSTRSDEINRKKSWMISDAEELQPDRRSRRFSDGDVKVDLSSWNLSLDAARRGELPKKGNPGNSPMPPKQSIASRSAGRRNTTAVAGRRNTVDISESVALLQKMTTPGADAKQETDGESATGSPQMPRPKLGELPHTVTQSMPAIIDVEHDAPKKKDGTIDMVARAAVKMIDKKNSRNSVDTEVTFSNYSSLHSTSPRQQLMDIVEESPPTPGKRLLDQVPQKRVSLEEKGGLVDLHSTDRVIHGILHHGDDEEHPIQMAGAAQEAVTATIPDMEKTLRANLDLLDGLRKRIRSARASITL